MTMRRLSGIGFVAPFVGLYSSLLILPFIMGVWISFHRADLFGTRHWVGLENYARLFADPVFYQAMGTTFSLALLIVPALTLITLLLALALNRATRSAAIFRGLFFSSSVLSVTIVTLIWRFVLTPDAGLVAKLLTAMGFEPLPFLSDPNLTVPALAITTIWWGLGLPMMLFLAGLQFLAIGMVADGVIRRLSFQSKGLGQAHATKVWELSHDKSDETQIVGSEQKHR